MMDHSDFQLVCLICGRKFKPTDDGVENEFYFINDDGEQVGEDDSYAERVNNFCCSLTSAECSDFERCDHTLDMWCDDDVF